MGDNAMPVTTVVLAEDDTDIRELVQLILEDVGYQIVTTRNGPDALAECRSRKPALALLDVNMPGAVDGLTVTRELRADPATNDIPILLLSALGQRTDVERGLEAGADDYIVKPFDPEELLVRIGRLVPGRPAT